MNPPRLILPRLQPRPTAGRCYACGHQFAEGTLQSAIAQHIARCGERFMERHRNEHAGYDLQSRDPEFEDWAEKAYVQGRLKPSTKRIY
jgi:predicted  nucleic acid-binding Zn-ribbon protein